MSLGDRGDPIDVACPACEAKPGAPCTYEGDLFSYSWAGPHRVKTLVHRRGDPLTSGYYGRRLGVVKARRLAERPARPDSSTWREGKLTDAEICGQFVQGYALPEIARRAELSVSSVRRRLRAAGYTVPVA